MRFAPALLIAAAMSGPAALAQAQGSQAVAEKEPAPLPAASEAKPIKSASKIEHTPVTKWPRGKPVLIKAKIDDPSSLFAPRVYARPTGTKRFRVFSLIERKRNFFTARLPSSMLLDGSLEYFIEAQHELSEEISRVGSAQNPFTVLPFDPIPDPILLTLRSDVDGAAVQIDDKPAGQTPLTTKIRPGTHVLSVLASDGRGSEQAMDIGPDKDLDFLVPMPDAPNSPSSIQVASTPTGARVLVDGKIVGNTPWEATMAEGRHTVGVELAGHLRQERQITVREGWVFGVTVALPLLPAGTPVLQVDSEPPGAVLVVDGKEKGRTPFVGPIPAGHHTAVVRMEGRREVGTDFLMPKSNDLSFRLDLPPAGELHGPHATVTSNPPGAALFIDGKEMGPTPWSGGVLPGVHKLLVTLPGYSKEERKVELYGDRDADVAIALARLPGPARVQVETDPAGASVVIDGKPAGDTPFTAEISAGEHQLQVAKDGYRSVAQDMSLEANQQLSLKLALQEASNAAVPPVIAVATNPSGAQLFIDGKLAGVTPIRAKSTPGAHEVKIVLEGYVTRTGKVNLPNSKDFEMRFAVSLKSERGNAEAHAAPGPLEFARAQLKRAQACFRQGDFACAVAGYQAAYEYKPVTELLFNIGQARRRKGDYKEALEAYRAFVKETNQSKLKGEAEKYIVKCEEAQKAQQVASADPSVPAAPAAAPVEEDTEPPVVTHRVIEHAVRNERLRLTATIVDERSEVAQQQACWRNLYQRDYECAPLALVGQDEYGVEVPARSVVDGFAYYLEAYDSSENGPARSGAPELPHTVVIDDAPAPKPVLALAESNATPAVAREPAPVEYVQAAPPEKESNHVISYISLGGAAAAVGAGALLYWNANKATNDLNASPHTGDEVASTQTRVKNEQLVANVLFGVSGALILGAVAFWNF